jgi:hypothetical protein
VPLEESIENRAVDSLGERRGEKRGLVIAALAQGSAERGDRYNSFRLPQLWKSVPGGCEQRSEGFSHGHSPAILKAVDGTRDRAAIFNRRANGEPHRILFTGEARPSPLR